MKTIISLLFIALAAIASAQDSGVIIIPSSDDVRDYVHLNSNGTYWSPGGEGKLVKISQNEVVIERTGSGYDPDHSEKDKTKNSMFVMLGSGESPTVNRIYFSNSISREQKPKRWREVYTLKNGKLTLAKIILPKITPAKPAEPERLTWDEAEAGK